jgi:uncharacterized membrane protein
MESRAKLLGHPIHQMLIVFPLGVLAMSLVFDLIARFAGQPKLHEAAFYMITGWLGGELVGRLGVAVDDGANLDTPSSLHGPVTGRGTTTRARV